MDTDHWRLLETAFHNAAALAPDARAAYLRRAHPEDAELVAEVERLLVAGDHAEAFLEELMRRSGPR